MKFIISFLLFFFTVFILQAQPVIGNKKYPSLLWEISGKGIKQPSYLIGTMHVSNKLAFNLPDSFYIAIRKAQVVALETNPETWQEDMSKYAVDGKQPYNSSSLFYSKLSMPNDYLTINTLKFFDYYSKIEESLYSNPSAINSLLYRSYGNESSDFEEDTYLDMYIYQCGKKWGKKVTGVEDYDESMRLMAEAYKDAAKDKNKKDRSYGDLSEEYSADKLQEAYRTGNLDLLDSINKYNSVSAAFDEKFLYRRNEIQATSIDSIIKSGSVLFVGVGAAHLPGDRGVIEILREKGYTLRPIKMGERASREKDMVDKIRVPVAFKKESTDDGFLTVDIPGKFYKITGEGALDQYQYADMANGSYYMLTRVMTNAWMWNQKEEHVYKKLDSLLYENIPGKIIQKTSIIKNGYKGIDLTNRTRRGDLQRYNIFITPFEIILFKMSGNGDYISQGVEASKFFGSIQLKEYNNGKTNLPIFEKYSPPKGGFTINFPHKPYVGNDGSWIYDAVDNNSGTYFRVIKTSIHNYRFAEEDTFDLGLMNESFMASEFIDSQISRHQTTYKGYPALDGKYRDKTGAVFLTRFLIQGPHYYSIIAHGNNDLPVMHTFLNSFQVTPFNYGSPKLQSDTLLYYSVMSTLNSEEKKINIDLPQNDYFGMNEMEEELSEETLLEKGVYRNKIISNDSTGEKIFITFYRSPGYFYTKDSSLLESDNKILLGGDSSWIFRLNKKYDLGRDTKVWETIVSDTGSSRSIWIKTYYRNGIAHTLMTQTDTLSSPSSFVKNFFESFTPDHKIEGVNPFEKKTTIFFNDFFSNDSLKHKKAVSYISQICVDSTNIFQLKKAIADLTWSDNKYLETKKELISKFDKIPTSSSADYLKELYYVLDDTIQLQYTVLEALLQQRTSISFNVFRDIINNEPPILDFSDNKYDDYGSFELLGKFRSAYNSIDNGNFLDELSDTLQLTKTILPDILPLLNLEDYKNSIMILLGKMVDSGIIHTNDLEFYFAKFLIEAKQALRKQSIAEKKRSITKAEEDKLDKKNYSYTISENDKDIGNADLNLYTKLLLPFWDSKIAVEPLILQILTSADNRLKFNTLMLLIDNKKSFPDTLLNYFGGLDDYRYELYKALKLRGKLSQFPVYYNNHLALSKSVLMEKETYIKPDTIVYLDRLETSYNGKDGFFYFYKYKARKDDINWKIATAGLIPLNPSEFEFEESSQKSVSSLSAQLFDNFAFSKYDFNSFTDTRIITGKPIDMQLKTVLRKMLISRRKSAKEFYEKSDDGY